MEMERYGLYRSCNFSSSLSGGKVDLFTPAALPLLLTAVKSHFPAFLLSDRRKSGFTHSCSFTAVTIGGKVSFSSFPPL